MAEKIITIDIDKEAGTMQVETSGFVGKGCDAIHKALEGDDVKVTSDQHKPEYYAGGGVTGHVTSSVR